MNDNDLYDKTQDEIKELRRLLRLAVDDLGKIAAIDECVFPYCDERCPFQSYTDCCEHIPKCMWTVDDFSELYGVLDDKRDSLNLRDYD